MKIKALIGYLVMSCLMSCHDDTALEAILLNHTVLEMEIGETYELQTELRPSEASVSTLVWHSTNPEIVSVTAGKLTAQQEGTANITVAANDINATCIVVVTPPELPDALAILPKSAKRGVSYNFTIDSDVNLLAPYISWSYNWGPDVTDNIGQLFKSYNLDFCPMAWNGAYDAGRIRACKAANPDCEYLLAFNEPNLTDQCNYTPAQAAGHWNGLKALADELDMKIVSPAMNYGTLDGYGDPVVWLDEFFTFVSPDDVDAIAIHCYMGTAGALKSYVERFYKYGKPIWLTEFCAWESHISSVQAQMNFMSEAITYLEADPMVERYAWFIPRADGPVDSYPYMQLLTRTKPFALSELGQVFAGLSPLDKNTWQSTDNYILPNTYTATCSQESIGKTGWIAGPHLRPTTDATGQLQLADFMAGQWVEYQIEPQEHVSTLRIRYAAYSDTSLQIGTDGTEIALAEAEKTGDASVWKTLEIPVDITAGKHTLRITVQKGNININWFKFDSNTITL